MNRDEFLKVTRATSDRSAIDEFEEVPTIEAAAGLGIRWSGWAGDMFTPWNPTAARAIDRIARGPWEHWIELALAILQDDLTRVVRPRVHDYIERGGEVLERTRPYREVSRSLTIEELWQRFGDPEPAVVVRLSSVDDRDLIDEINRRGYVVGAELVPVSSKEGSET